MAGLERYSPKTLRTFAVGDIGPSGGFIFATPSTSGNETGKYFEAAPYGWNGVGADPKRTWAQTSYQTSNVLGATGTAYGTGYANTLAIIAQGNTDPATSAAALARTCTSGGKNDWFLPSSFELGQMVSALFYDNGDIGGLNNPDNLGNANYWGSTQETGTIYGDAFSRASMWLYLDAVGPLKSESHSVRPVRMFSVEPSSSVQRIGNDSVYGTGSDGTVVIASNTSLSRDMYYNNLTINTGVHLNTNGYRVFVKNTLTLTGNIGVIPQQLYSNSTLAERMLLGSGNIAKAIGGNSGGNTYTASQITDSDRKNIETLISGIVIDTEGTVSAIRGGAAGASGASGTLTPATNGGAGELNRNALAPGGPGTAGTTPPASVGGTGGIGGGIVLIVAKQITGLGTILAQGQNANVGANSSTGSAGTAAPNQPLTHLVDGSKHYITGDGTHGPHASTPTPNLPHGGPNVAYAENYRHGYTYHHVHRGVVHHTTCSGDCSYWCGVQTNRTFGHGPGTYNFGAANNQGGNYAHHSGDYNNNAHVDSLTGTYYGINSIDHTPGHRGNIGEARIADSSHTSGEFHIGHDGPHQGVEHNGGHGGDKFFSGCGAWHIASAWPRYHNQYNHGTYRYRTAGSVSSQGSVVKNGGTAGAAGSSTAGSAGITGGGGGIIIITDSIANTVVTSTIGGTVSGGGAGQSGSVITILNT
jgi:hypothetical protein